MLHSLQFLPYMVCCSHEPMIHMKNKLDGPFKKAKKIRAMYCGHETDDRMLDTGAIGRYVMYYMYTYILINIRV